MIVESSLRAVEKKALGALLILADKDMVVKATQDKIARTMGYKSSGGLLSSSIQALEMKNYIAVLEKGMFKILL